MNSLNQDMFVVITKLLDTTNLARLAMCSKSMYKYVTSLIHLIKQNAKSFDDILELNRTTTKLNTLIARGRYKTAIRWLALGVIPNDQSLYYSRGHSDLIKEILVTSALDDNTVLNASLITDNLTMFNYVKPNMKLVLI